MVIEPRKGWIGLELAELWSYRELFYVLAERDVRVRYKQTVLGAAWAVLQPVMTMIVFSVFFGYLAKVPSDGSPYPIFVYAGLLPWIYFSTATTAAANSLVGSSQLVSKVYFPRLVIPFAAVGAGVLDFLIATVVLLVLMIYYQTGIGWHILLFPAVVFCATVSALGIGTLLAALNVAYRDFRYVITFLLQLWMLATPIAYPVSIVPEGWRLLYHLNPMAGVVELSRTIFLGKAFDAAGFVVSMASALVILFVSLAYFKSVERRFADII